MGDPVGRAHRPGRPRPLSTARPGAAPTAAARGSPPAGRLSLSVEAERWAEPAQEQTCGPAALGARQSGEWSEPGLRGRARRVAGDREISHLSKGPKGWAPGMARYARAAGTAEGGNGAGASEGWLSTEEGLMPGLWSAFGGHDARMRAMETWKAGRGVGGGRARGGRGVHDLGQSSGEPLRPSGNTCPGSAAARGAPRRALVHAPPAAACA
jgi:hypothetical protein